MPPGDLGNWVVGRGDYLELDNGARLVVVVGKKGKGELDVGA
jgi:hypothetical protein